jgi:outer membrane protein OmpA-like peptidoglycan-associated protein
MKRITRTVMVAALAVVALPGVAAAQPDVPDQNLVESVLDLRAGQSVFDIDLSRAVIPLEEESASGGSVTVRISADVLFDFGQANLTGTARREIGEIATRLRGTTEAVRVVGFTDNIGTPASNLALSRRRAVAVKTELAKQANGAAIVAIGRGEANPVAPNTKDGKDYPAGRALNRRVEITFNTS